VGNARLPRKVKELIYDVTVRLPESQYRRLREEAMRTNTSMQAVLVDALKQRLDRDLPKV
jgi:predicted transcriptional regulator